MLALLEENKEEIFGTVDGTWQLMVYGSAINGLGHCTDSDLDLTIILDDFDVSHEIILRNISRVL